MIFEEKLKLANVFLLNKPSLKYLGIISYGLEKVALSKEEYESIGSKDSCAFTDTEKIYFLVDDETSVERLVEINIHEILHIISDHLTRARHRDPEIWNCACDHVVNRMVFELCEKYSFIERPDDGIFFEDIHRKYPKATVEDVYDLLLNDQQKQQQGQGQSDYQITSTDIGNDKKTVQVKNNQTNEVQKGAMDTKPVKGNFSQVKKQSDKLKVQAKILWESTSIDKGEISANFQEYLDGIFKVEVPWEDILQQALTYYSHTADQPSWIRKNIYFRNVRLPGYIDGQDTQTLVACIDTSGSVSSRDLKKFIGVLMGCINNYKQLIVIMHDSSIKDVVRFSSLFNEADITSRLSKIHGRGGTSHKDVFDKIDRLWEDDEEISTVVFLTDYGSDVERIYKKYQWLRDITTIWILNRHYKKPNLEGCKTLVIEL